MLAQEANPSKLILATWSQPFIPRFWPISNIHEYRVRGGSPFDLGGLTTVTIKVAYLRVSYCALYVQLRLRHLINIRNKLNPLQSQCHTSHPWRMAQLRPLFTANMFLVTSLHPVHWTHRLAIIDDVTSLFDHEYSASVHVHSCRRISAASLLVRLLCASKMSFINYMVKMN